MNKVHMPVFITILFASAFALLAGCSAESTSDTESAEQNENVVEGVWYSIEEAQEKAEAENKKIVIAVYTDWCSICRRMDREVYSKDDIIGTFSDYYYPVRLNAESDKEVTFNGETYKESELALAFGVTSYPTVVFVDETGNPFGSQPGFIEKDVFQDILVFVGSDAYKDQSFEDYKEL
ncbi:MAG: thioredoxin fold domain-containing protein [Balneolales bacterium]